MYIYTIYTYTYINIYTICELPGRSCRRARSLGCAGGFSTKTINTPSPPKSFPTKSPRVELSGRLPIRSYGPENSHPLDFRVCLSQTLWNPNS